MSADVKLAETERLFQKLVIQSEKVVTPEPEAFGRWVKNFLVEGDSLVQLLKTRGYDWKTWGAEDDREFLTFMNEQRRDEIYRGGSAMTFHTEWIPASQVPHPPGQHPAHASSYTFVPGTDQPTLGRRVYSFKDHGKVVDCCKRYVDLLETLVG